MHGHNLLPVKGLAQLHATSQPYVRGRIEKVRSRENHVQQRPALFFLDHLAADLFEFARQVKPVTKQGDYRCVALSDMQICIPAPSGTAGRSDVSSGVIFPDMSPRFTNRITDVLPRADGRQDILGHAAAQADSDWYGPASGRLAHAWPSLS